MGKLDKESSALTAEEKGAKFLQWVADNQNEMKRALRKNCTYDPDIFDDVFSETILNVHSTIVKNNRDIDNLKNYFFLAVKWQYQMRQNQSRKQRDNAVRDYWQNHTVMNESVNEEARDEDLTTAYNIIWDVLAEEYGEWWTKVFFTYWQSRSKYEGSYQTLADKFNCDNTENFKSKLQQMRTFVVNELGFVRDIYNKDYADD